MRGTADAPRGRVLALAAVGVVTLNACAGSPGRPELDQVRPGSLPQGSEAVELDPADFSVDITNPFWPMDVGDRWVFEETDGTGSVQRVEVTVLDETYTVSAGIEARVVHDLVTEDGTPVEDTLDWYAQDRDGNVWYLGEQTAEYENGQVVSTEGSWEAGVDGAQPGIAVPGNPEPGLGYRQEYLAGEAEDEAVVLSVSEQVESPTGRYTGALLTRDVNPLHPELAELKFYAPGVGPVLVLQTSGGDAREALVETTR
ncbi:hypothetical protein [Blastococcus sp. CT_GayMR16]|uniref:hypothetical protein n=1 Tax=Blastococcus sp. CT_GayMR16 TaxID=2559607 RepID=UPI0010732F27|nr:hypothetical protein [Blastococcus sp. CT_GayMR16]TFV86626.1 hypothetical protein E4P38_16595 [Blastococcus sp. CT_GayMR16]